MVILPVLLVLALTGQTMAILDGLAPTPPMGFSSWNTFFGENNEEKMIGIADAIVRLGLDEFGYTYVQLDDYWMLRDRDADGNMQEDLGSYPNGIKFLSDHIHSLGLKFGIYSSAGWYTCGGRAASLGHEEQDMQLFLQYEIDLLKYDNCYPIESGGNTDYAMSALNLPSYWQSPSEQSRYEPMFAALAAAKPIRNITMEICSWGWGSVELWGPEGGHYWRTGGDAWDGWPSFLYQIDRNDELRYLPRQGPSVGGWNYPDALFVGKGGMTDTEYRSSFALFCAIKSPLYLGSDLREMTTDDVAYEIITNRELLDINQDSLGIQATCVKECCARTALGALYDEDCPFYNSAWQVWMGPLSGDSFMVVVLNRFDNDIVDDLDWFHDAKIPAGSYNVRDLWAHEDIGQIEVDESGSSLWPLMMEVHANLALKLSPA